MIHLRLALVCLLLALAGCGAPGTAPQATPPATVSQASATPAPPTAAPSATPAPPTAAPVPVATLTAELSATLTARLPPTATPDTSGSSGFGAIEGFDVFPLDTSDGRLLWAVSSYGMRSYDPPQNHFVAIYTYDDSGWQELSRLELERPDYTEGVTQVQVVPDRLWLALESGVGAHGGCYDLLSFDGAALRSEVSHCHESPGAASLSDVDGDGVRDVVLNRTWSYIFCYACGVRLQDYGVMRWDGERFVEVGLTPLPDTQPAEPRETINRAVTLAQAWLWKDALAEIEQLRVEELRDQAAVWDVALIRLIGEARAEQAASGAYPLLDNLFYGDYEAAMELMRQYSPEEIFHPQTPLIDGTVAEGWEPDMTYWITTTTTLALEARPDLATAYFLRGWGLRLNDPDNPQVVADIRRAAELKPEEELFVNAAAYLTNE